MARLHWHQVGEKTYEAGVDRGVLYIDSDVGIPWNGLVSVNEQMSDAQITEFYYDGVKYLNTVSNAEYKASIMALSYPPQFDLCQGYVSPYPGLILTNQYRTPFGLSYRTLIGSDILGLGDAYKIHLVYNATATPSSLGHTSVGDVVVPSQMQWDVSAVPPMNQGRTPTAHLVIDSRDISASTLADLEGLLYGNSEQDSSLPEQSVLAELLSEGI
jgi:hypothetical protein